MTRRIDRAYKRPGPKSNPMLMLEMQRQGLILVHPVKAVVVEGAYAEWREVMYDAIRKEAGHELDFDADRGQSYTWQQGNILYVPLRGSLHHFIVESAYCPARRNYYRLKQANGWWIALTQAQLNKLLNRRVADYLPRRSCAQSAVLVGEME